MATSTGNDHPIVAVAGLYTCAHAGEPMQYVDQATLLAGRGLQGDRYCLQQGTYSVLPEVGRQLTLISDHVLDHELFRNVQCGAKGFDMGRLRRNVVLHGISPGDLLAAVGRVVTIGAASKISDNCQPNDPAQSNNERNDDGCQLLVHRNCVPCPYNERLNQLPGLRDALWLDMGVSCEILRGETIRCGDSVRICSPPLPDNNNKYKRQDPHPPSFYVPPKQRTAAMVRNTMEHKRALYQRLLVQDPGGAARIEASYQKVGLSFWPPIDNTRGCAFDENRPL